MAKSARKPAPRRGKSGKAAEDAAAAAPAERRARLSPGSPDQKDARKSARKNGQGRGGGPSAGAAGDPPAGAARAMEAALLDLCARQGWRDLSLADIAEAAGLGMAAAHAAYGTKAALLAGLVRSTDAEILDSLAHDQLEGGPRDRLFDLMMRRFDRLQQSREGYLTLLRELPLTPFEATAMACQGQRSLRLMLEVAGISASGLKGYLRVQGLMAIQAAALRVWSRDDSDDLAATMAEIDKRIRQAERADQTMRRGMQRAQAVRQQFDQARAPSA